MKRFKEWLLSGVLSVAITPLAFLLMPFIAIGAIFGSVATWISGLFNRATH